MPNKRKCRYARRLDEERVYIPKGHSTKHLHTLDLDQFEAMRLVDVEGMSQIDAAQEMEVSRATIQRLLTKGRKAVTEAILWNHGIEVSNATQHIKLKGENNMNIANQPNKTIAFPSSDGRTIDHHFGHTREFVIYSIEDNTIVDRRIVTPPPHTPGAIPAFLRKEEIDIVITGNMGQRAIALFKHNDIDVILGAKGDIEDNLTEYLDGILESTGSGCGQHHGDHDHEHHHEHEHQHGHGENCQEHEHKGNCGRH